MTDENRHVAAEKSDVRVRGVFFRRIADWWEATRSVRDTEEVVFLVECREASQRNPASTHELTIELWRGNEIRDQQEQSLHFEDQSLFTKAYSVTWSRRPAASSRLRCHAIVDGADAGWWELLVQHLSIDAQGRLSLDNAPRESAETLLAYQHALATLCEHPATQRL